MNLSGTTVPNPGINPGIPGLAFLNPEIPELENGPGIAIPSYDSNSNRNTNRIGPIYRLTSSTWVHDGPM